MKKAFLTKHTTAAAVVCVTNLLLFLIKLYVGISSGSISIYSDAFNNLLDSISGIIIFLGFLFISSEPDEKYPFGRGRLHELLNIFTGCIIISAGLSFAFSSAERIIYPSPVSFTDIYVFVILFTAVIKLALALYLRFFCRQTATGIIKGLYIDSLLDFFITLCSCTAFTVSAKTGINIDGIAGMLISIFIITSGIRILKDFLPVCIGRRNDEICSKAEDFLTREGLTVYEVQCHSYAETKVFTVRISQDSCCSEGVINRFRDRFSADIYFIQNNYKEVQ